MQKLLFLFVVLNVLFVYAPVYAQEVVPDTVTFVKARVVEIIEQQTTTNPVTGLPLQKQVIRAEVLEGESQGETVTLTNDYLLLKEGGLFYARHTINSLEGIDWWVVSDPYRLPTLLVFSILFLVSLVLFGGKQGIRGFFSLVLSILLINYVLLPSVLNGYPPILVSIVVASFIIVLGSYVTHGFNRTTTAAVVGMLLAVLVAGTLAYASIYFGKLTGYPIEGASLLNLNSRGAIDLPGVLFGGFLIGLLGILYDAAIGQAIAIEELKNVGQRLSRLELYTRGIRIGREHVGALVNMLAIAYVGVSLPLLLLFKQASTQSVFTVINQEEFATEILRTLVGSTGIILSIPITTAVAVVMLYDYKKRERNKSR